MIVRRAPASPLPTTTRRRGVVRRAIDPQVTTQRLPVAGPDRTLRHRACTGRPSRVASPSMVRRVRPPQPRAGLGRREFLRATLVSAAGLLAGCKPEEPAGEAGDETGTETETETETGDEPPREVVDGFEYFPQSVASGDPRPGSVILWTRVEDPDAPDQDLELELELASDPEFANPIGDRILLTATAAHDHCVKVRVIDLPPGQPIHYRFVYP